MRLRCLARKYVTNDKKKSIVVRDGSGVVVFYIILLKLIKNYIIYNLERNFLKESVSVTIFP